MHRFSFRAPTKGKRKETKQPEATLHKTLPLFERRGSETPSLDELASPEPFASEPGLGSEGSGRYDEYGVKEDSEEDERERLRRAKARAFTRGPTPVPYTQIVGLGDAVDSASEYSPREIHEHEEEEYDGEGAMDELTTDVVELQRQVRGLLQSRVDAEDAWRKENELLREQLTAAESREAQLHGRVQQLQERLQTTSPTTSHAAESARPTPRERELLRLLVRIVGKEQIRVLLAPGSSSTHRTPAQLRRQLVTRAVATHRRPLTAVCSAAPPATQSDVSTRKPRPSVLLTTTVTPRETLLSGTRKHEMSDAM